MKTTKAAATMKEMRATKAMKPMKAMKAAAMKSRAMKAAAAMKETKAMKAMKAKKTVTDKEMAAEFENMMVALPRGGGPWPTRRLFRAWVRVNSMEFGARGNIGRF